MTHKGSSKHLRRPAELGRELENAVKLLEQGILSSFPGYRKDTFIVEARKRVKVKDVTHEIDLWVTVNHGKGYKSHFLFECKNRKRPATKNDVAVFSEKLRAVQAQAGYFVSKSFTRDAVAQARLDPRVRLLVAEEGDTIIPFQLGVRVIFPRQPSTWLGLHVRDKGDLQWRSRDFRRFSVCAGGAATTLHEYTERWLGEIIDDQNTRLIGAGVHAGEYSWTRVEERKFSEGEFVLEGFDIDKFELTAIGRTAVVEPKLNVRFSIEDRGNVHVFMPVGLPGKAHISVQLVTHRHLEDEAD